MDGDCPKRDLNYLESSNWAILFSTEENVMAISSKAVNSCQLTTQTRIFFATKREESTTSTHLLDPNEVTQFKTLLHLMLLRWVNQDIKR